MWDSNDDRSSFKIDRIQLIGYSSFRVIRCNTFFSPIPIKWNCWPIDFLMKASYLIMSYPHWNNEQKCVCVWCMQCQTSELSHIVQSFVHNWPFRINFALFVRVHLRSSHITHSRTTFIPSTMCNSASRLVNENVFFFSEINTLLQFIMCISGTQPTHH